MSTARVKTARRPTWKRANPKARAGTSRHLTAGQKATARKRAKRAGRRYPNLVDNMEVAREAKKR
jgi:hypothetical protein